MPTIRRIEAYRFYFFSSEGDEPPHVHVDRERMTAKFWLEPVRLGRNLGFPPLEVRRIQRLVEENREEFLEAWNAYFEQ